MVKAAGEAITAITPYADLIGFKKGEVSFLEKSAEDRLQTAVMTLDKVLGKIDVISDDIKEAENRIDKINPSRYPKKIGKMLVRERIDAVIDGGRTKGEAASTILDMTCDPPSILREGAISAAQIYDVLAHCRK